MPTYDYECSSCGYKFEIFQSMSEAPKKKCPKCGKSVKRLIGSGSGIIFKGSGFYATDYKKSAAKSEASCASGKADSCKTCPHANKGK